MCKKKYKIALQNKQISMLLICETNSALYHVHEQVYLTPS